MKKISTFLLSSLLFSGSIEASAREIILDMKGAVTTVIAKSLGVPAIKAKHYRTVAINLDYLKTQLAKVNSLTDNSDEMLIELPFPDGSWHSYRITTNSVMAPELANKYPEIKTYNAYGVDHPGELAKLDITPQGFHAMVVTMNRSRVLIDPYLKDDTHYYIIYKDKNVSSKALRCGVHTTAENQSNGFTYQENFTNFASCQLRKYRLAMAATYQYTTYNGGTKTSALAAITTMMNRINAVYELDDGVTMELIPNEDQIIYTTVNDPYASAIHPDGTDAAEMLALNQSNLDSTIGTNNYDIGHVVSQTTVSPNGIAVLRSVCNSSIKAMGATLDANPVGDSFDIDYVAHEIGHQFGANHTQNNNCNRNNATAVEPGSGSTIIAYAGICSPNVQAHSNAYFHGISMQEIGTYISGAGDCGVKTPLPDAPIITAQNNITIPIGTPFALSAQAYNQVPSTTPILYSWEQINPSSTGGLPLPTATTGPNFRSVTPSKSGIRYFPNLAALAQNNTNWLQCGK